MPHKQHTLRPSHAVQRFVPHIRWCVHGQMCMGKLFFRRRLWPTFLEITSSHLPIAELPAQAAHCHCLHNGIALHAANTATVQPYNVVLWHMTLSYVHDSLISRVIYV